MDIINIIIGILLMILSLLIGIPKLNDKLQGKVDDYGSLMKIIVGALGLFIVGIAMVLREFF